MSDPNDGPCPSDQDAMTIAIDESSMAHRRGDMPYGAALFAADGRLLHRAGNRQHSSADPTAHAEMVLVREAAALRGLAALSGSTAYASGEPCAMCAGALYWAGVSRIVYALPQATMAEVMGGELLPIGCAAVLAGASRPVQVQAESRVEPALAVLQAAVRQKTPQRS